MADQWTTASSITTTIITTLNETTEGMNTTTTTLNETTEGMNTTTTTTMELESPCYALIIMTVSVFITIIVGTLGNLLTAVCPLVTKNKKLRENPCTPFMVGMPACLVPTCAFSMGTYGVACVEVLVSGISVIPDWLKTSTLITYLICTQAHLHIICVLAFSRLVAIIRPVTYQRMMQPRTVAITLSVVCGYSAVLFLPLAFRVFGYVDMDLQELKLTIKFHEPVGAKLPVFVFLTYGLPVVFTSVCYFMMYFKVVMARRARAKKSSGNSNTIRQWENHVTRTILALFLIFVLCNIPRFVVRAIDQYKSSLTVWRMLHSLYWLQFTMDPIVYVVMSMEYRAATLECLRKIFCVGKIAIFQSFSSSSSGNEIKTRQELKTQSKSISSQDEAKPLQQASHV